MSLSRKHSKMSLHGFVKALEISFLSLFDDLVNDVARELISNHLMRMNFPKYQFQKQRPSSPSPSWLLNKPHFISTHLSILKIVLIH